MQTQTKGHLEIAKQARLKILNLIFKAQTSHIGSNFSCVEILTVLFDKMDIIRDKFICSKGWVAAAVYYFMWTKGIITEEELDSFCQEGSKFIGLIEPMGKFGAEFAGGSMGMGLPAAVGFALAKKLRGEEGNIYCLMSDGELQCGTTWESMLIANQFNLNNLIVLVDNNHYQAMGKVEDVLAVEPLLEKFMALGWKILGIDGNDCQQIKEALEMDWESAYSSNGISVQEDLDIKNKPLIIVCDTIKGKGVSWMENDNLYHYKQLSQDEYERAKQELR